jgi:hypothetical protein
MIIVSVSLDKFPSDKNISAVSVMVYLGFLKVASAGFLRVLKIAVTADLISLKYK